MSPHKPLPTFRLATGICVAQSSAAHHSPVGLDSPAREVVTDLALVKAVTTAPSTLLRQAEQLMIAHGVRMLFVAADGSTLDGLVTSTDLHGDHPVRLGHERGLRYDELSVADVMTPLASLDAVDFDTLRNASVGDLVATLQRFGRHHMLAVQGPTHATPQRVRGVISRAQIERQLGTAIDITPIAGSFSEIERMLHHA